MTFEEWWQDEELKCNGAWYYKYETKITAMRKAWSVAIESIACCGTCEYWSTQWNICANDKSEQYNLPHENTVEKYCEHFEPRRKE